jgi:RNA polymerase sigma-70 factor, ECF subfamily
MTDHHSWPTTSVDLLKQLKNLGNAEAWDRFYRAYRPLVDRMGQRRGLQPADVEDVTQQVLIAVSKQISTFEYDPERGQFRGWLATITARSIAKRWHAIGRQNATSPLADELVDAMVEADCVEEFHGVLMETALETVKTMVEPHEWEAFHQLWQLDIPAKQIASKTGNSLSWVYRTKYKLLNLMTLEVRRLTDDVAFIHK